MAEGVVDALEVIQIQEEQGGPAAVTQGPGARLAQPIREQPAVGQAGQIVIERLPLDGLFGAPSQVSHLEAAGQRLVDPACHECHEAEVEQADNPELDCRQVALAEEAQGEGEDAECEEGQAGLDERGEAHHGACAHAGDDEGEQ